MNSLSSNHEYTCRNGNGTCGGSEKNKADSGDYNKTTTNSRSNRYAFVTLVMLNDDYVYGALALATSIKENLPVSSSSSSSPSYDVVCLVTEHVTLVGRHHLEKVFDHVILIKHIHKECPFKTKGQAEIYKASWNSFLTKLAIFTLTQYDKVLFMDADMIVMEPIHHLFGLEAPAGGFNGSILHPFALKSGYSPQSLEECVCDNFHPGTRRGAINFYLGIKHGERIGWDQIERAMSEWSTAVSGCLLLIQPREGDYEQMLLDLQEFDFSSTKCHSSPEEQFLTWWYSPQWRAKQKKTGFSTKHQSSSSGINNGQQQRPFAWTLIHQKYQMIPWKTPWLENTPFRSDGKNNFLAMKNGEPPETPAVYHYWDVQKPWTQQKNEWPDLKIWHHYWEKCLETKFADTPPESIPSLLTASFPSASGSDFKKETHN